MQGAILARCNSTSIRCLFALLISALLAASCTGTSEPDVSATSLPTDTTVPGTDINNAAQDSSSVDSNDGLDDDPAGSGDSTAAVDNPSVTLTEGENGSDSVPEDVAVPVPDPVTQQTTQVEFSITVPPYQSNELQVGITWGNKAFSARWVGDEFWVANDEFSTNTEHNLIVTFYDANGEITLGRYETLFRTGVNDSQVLEISADQFNVDQWDTDGDGTSNLDESITGNDPLLDESTTLPVVDSVMLWNDVLSVSQQLEARIGEQRPFLEVKSEYIPLPEDEPNGTWFLFETNFDIDVDGNGTMSDTYKERFYSESHSGTRTHSENSISWEGNFNTFDGDYSRSREFTSDMTYIDENTRGFVDRITETYTGFFTDEWDISSNISGEIVETSSHCQPVSGTISRAHGTNRDGPFSTETITVSKELDDAYWKVVAVNRDGDANEYLARELILRQTDVNGRNLPTFFCDPVEF